MAQATRLSLQVTQIIIQAMAIKKMLILLPPIDDVVENPMCISAEDIGQKKVAKQAIAGEGQLGRPVTF